MKPSIRQHIKSLLKSVSDSEKQHAKSIWLDFFLSHLAQHSKCALYYPLSFEPDTTPLIKACWQQGCKVYLPQINSKEMIFSEYTPSTPLVKSSLGFLKPDSSNIFDLNEIPLVVVPFIAVNHSKYRLGQGQGYYDRALSNYTGKKIGIGYQFQKVDFQKDMWDMVFDDVCLFPTKSAS